MLLKLPQEIQNIIYYFLDFNSLIILIISNRYFLKYIMHQPEEILYFWKRIAYRDYSEDFWYKASIRNKFLSNPLGDYFLELNRMKKFESLLKKYNIPFQKKDYYIMWDRLEKIYNKKN